MHNRKASNNEKDYCQGCPFYNGCKARFLELDTKISLCLMPRTMLINIKKDGKISSGDFVEAVNNLCYDLPSKISELNKSNPAAAKPLDLVKVSYNEAVKKAFDITTESSEAKHLQYALTRARDLVAKYAAKKLKRKTHVPLWAYTFTIFREAGKIVSVDYSDQP